MWNKLKQHITFFNAILILLHAVIPHHHHSIDSTTEGECSHVHAADNQHHNDHVVIDVNSNHHHGLHIDHEFDIGKCQLKKSKFVKFDISPVQDCNTYNPIFIHQLSIPVDDEAQNYHFDESFLPEFYTKSFSLRGPPALI